MAKTKFYAVRRGREGPKIYDNWSECERNVKGSANALHKSFPSREAAQAWIEEPGHTYVPHSAAPSHYNPWSDITDTEASHQPSPGPEIHAPLDIESFTDDSIPLPGSPDMQRTVSQKSNAFLSEEQEHILNLVQRGRNIFFTGSAGTGKSVLLREIIDHFGGNISQRLAITASTGIAALNIGGTTLHSFAGIGLGIENVEKLLKKILNNENSTKRWRRTQTLIIDEISMIDGVLFDKLEFIARKVRKNEKPFGGIQVLVSGDFCQLPPVPERRDGVDIPIMFAFEAKSWQRCYDENQTGIPMVYRLTKVFRQKDQAFVDMLNSIRNGQLDTATSAQFHKLARPIHYSDGLEPCQLFPLREQVREANETRLRRLPGNAQSFRAMDIGGCDVRHQHIDLVRAKKLLDRLIAPETIQLKIGAQVMLVKNLVQGRLINGSLGKVVGFQSLNDARGYNTEIAEVDKARDPRLAQRRNQGERAITDTDDQETTVFVDRVWPLVRFTNGRKLLLTPAEFEVVNVNGDMEARRDQVPLILAWALSIHKSQGQTLERVKVDLGRVFEKGQAYVALSRATSMEGLQVLNFHPSKVMAHPRVLAWQRRIEGNRAIKLVPAIPFAPELYDEFDGEEAMARYHQTALPTPPTPPTLLASPASQPVDDFDEEFFNNEEAMARYYQAVPLTPPVPEPFDEFDEFDDQEAMARYYAAAV